MIEIITTKGDALISAWAVASIQKQGDSGLCLVTLKNGHRMLTSTSYEELTERIDAAFSKWRPAE